MGSFSSVNNFRSSLSRRWGYVDYCFYGGLSFEQQVVERLFNRFVPVHLLMKLGIYFSHFLFSVSSTIFSNSFFFDFGLDYRYRRFARLFSKRKKKSRYFNLKNKRLDTKKHVKFRGSKSLNHKNTNGFRVHSPVIKFSWKKLDGVLSYAKGSSFPWNLDYRYKTTGYLGFRLFCRSIQFRIFGAGILLGLRFFFQVKKPKFCFRILSKSVRVCSVLIKKFPKNRNSLFSDFWLRKSILLRSSGKNMFRNFSLISVNFTKCIKVINSFFKFHFGFIQFRVAFSFVVKFFLGYYFRYYPFRFLNMFRTSGFLLSRSSKSLLIYLGMRFRWIYFSYKSIFNWLFNLAYSNFFRRNFFFNFRQNFKVISFLFQIVKPGGNSNHNLVNLSKFGTLPSKLISRVFELRLKRRERVNPILYSLIRLLLTRRRIRGFVILQNGRFTKRQRAIHSAYRIGRVSYNSYIMPIDYSISTPILKYSMVAIKIWIATAPAVSFFNQFGISDGGNWVYPSNLGGFLIKKYLYVWKIKNFFKYKYPIEFDHKFFFPYFRYFKIVCTKFIFTHSWNIHYIRAYRRFCKSFVFSKYNYVRRIQFSFSGKFILCN